MWLVAPPALADVPGGPDARYAFETLPLVSSAEAGGPDLDADRCTSTASFAPAWGSAIECPGDQDPHAAWDGVFDHAGSFTVAAWVALADPNPCPGTCTIAQQGNLEDVGPLGLVFRITDGRLRLTGHDGVAEAVVEGDPFPLGRWVHATVVVDQQDVAFYLDAAPAGAGSLGLVVAPQPNQPFFVGSAWNRAYDLVGRVDEVVWWSRPLSAVEVAAAYDWYVDADGDGHVGDADCDPTASSVHVGAVDAPGDGVDSDCDGADPAASESGTEPLDSAPDTESPGPDTGQPPGGTGPPAPTDTGEPPDPADPDPLPDQGCRCQARANPRGWGAGLLAAIVVRRRRSRSTSGKTGLQQHLPLSRSARPSGGGTDPGSREVAWSGGAASAGPEAAARRPTGTEAGGRPRKDTDGGAAAGSPEV